MWASAVVKQQQHQTQAKTACGGWPATPSSSFWFVPASRRFGAIHNLRRRLLGKRAYIYRGEEIHKPSHTNIYLNRAGKEGTQTHEMFFLRSLWMFLAVHGGSLWHPLMMMMVVVLVIRDEETSNQATILHKSTTLCSAWGWWGFLGPFFNASLPCKCMCMHIKFNGSL